MFLQSNTPKHVSNFCSQVFRAECDGDTELPHCTAAICYLLYVLLPSVAMPAWEVLHILLQVKLQVLLQDVSSHQEKILFLS